GAAAASDGHGRPLRAAHPCKEPIMNKPLFALVLGLALVAGPAMHAEAAEPTLNDSQVAHIAYTAGTIDVTAAKQALQKSHTPAVRAFAEEMARDHAAVTEQALALVKKLGDARGQRDQPVPGQRRRGRA